MFGLNKVWGMWGFGALRFRYLGLGLRFPEFRLWLFGFVGILGTSPTVPNEPEHEDLRWGLGSRV